jgi:hypothetical protein
MAIQRVTILLSQFTLSPIQVSTKEIFADCILYFQADKEIYEISLRRLPDRNDMVVIGGGKREKNREAIFFPLPHSHNHRCHLEGACD